MTIVLCDAGDRRIAVAAPIDLGMEVSAKAFQALAAKLQTEGFQRVRIDGQIPVPPQCGQAPRRLNREKSPGSNSPAAKSQSGQAFFDENRLQRPFKRLPQSFRRKGSNGYVLTAK